MLMNRFDIFSGSHSCCRFLDLVWRKEFALVYALGFLPLAILCSRYYVISRVLAEFKNLPDRIFLFASLAAPLSFTVMAVDMGRLVAFHTISATIFILSMCKIHGWSLKGKENNEPVNLYVFVPLLLVYALGWRMHDIHHNMRLISPDYAFAAMIILGGVVAYIFHEMSARASNHALAPEAADDAKHFVEQQTDDAGGNRRVGDVEGGKVPAAKEA